MAADRAQLAQLIARLLPSLDIYVREARPDERARAEQLLGDAQRALRLVQLEHPARDEAAFLAAFFDPQAFDGLCKKHEEYQIRARLQALAWTLRSARKQDKLIVALDTSLRGQHAAGGRLLITLQEYRPRTLGPFLVPMAADLRKLDELSGRATREGRAAFAEQRQAIRSTLRNLPFVSDRTARSIVNDPW